MRTFIAAAFSLICAFSVYAVDERKLVDMTYPFADDTLHWPTAKPFHLERVNEGRTAQGYWYSSYNYSGSEHVGTHLDAPFHFAEGKWTTDQIPLAQTIGPAVVIDVRRQAEADRDYRLDVGAIHGWEKRYGRIPKAVIVLVHTGWGKYWGDRKAYFGTDKSGDTSNLHFPGLSKEAAEFLVKERAVKAVGIDSPSIDYGPSRDFIVHQVLGGANIPIFENVAALDRLPTKGATVFAIPMKIKGGSGAPLRIFAVLP
ncbi:MAG TPA: cyclase family protein [Candidatus Binatia bacterium]|nr:cyclase family protein [Candidatus Binatia bacterium]